MLRRTLSLATQHSHKNFAKVPEPISLPVTALSEQGYNFQYPATVLWSHLDCLNHVNNTQFFRWMDEVRIQYFMTILGLGIGAQKVGSIMQHVDARFRLPVTFPDELVLCAKITEIKKDRVIMNHGIYSQQRKTLACIGDGTIVSFDYESNMVTNVPQDWINKILEVEGEANVKMSL